MSTATVPSPAPAPLGTERAPRPLPRLTPKQEALHAGITAHRRAFSLERAMQLYVRPATAPGK